jgi:hypothetical protein
MGNYIRFTCVWLSPNIQKLIKQHTGFEPLFTKKESLFSLPTEERFIIYELSNSACIFKNLEVISDFFDSDSQIQMLSAKFFVIITDIAVHKSDGDTDCIWIEPDNLLLQIP